MVLNREKNLFFYQFFKSMLARKGFFMPHYDIAVLRGCQRLFLLGLQFIDDVSDFFLRDCSSTTVPGQLFVFFYVKHKSPHWYALRYINLPIGKSIVQAKLFTTFSRRQDEPEIEVVRWGKREKNRHFFKSLLARKGFCMQTNK